MTLPENPIQRRRFAVALLQNKGITLAKIAQEEGVSPQAVSQAFISPNQRLEAVIAAKLEMAPEVLFSDRYSPDGTRLVQVRERKSSRRGRSRIGKNGTID